MITLKKSMVEESMNQECRLRNIDEAKLFHRRNKSKWFHA